MRTESLVAHGAGSLVNIPLGSSSVAMSNIPPRSPSDAPSPAVATRWKIVDDAAIAWEVRAREAHHDHIEMSGQRVSVIVTYGVDETGHFSVSRQVIWPMLRFKPNRTRDHLSLIFGEEATPRIFLDQMLVSKVTVTRVVLDGLLRVEGTLGESGEIAFVRTLFPSTTRPAIIDTTEFINRSGREVSLEIEGNERRVHTNPERGVYGGYTACAQILGVGERKLKPEGSTSFSLVVSARKNDEEPPSFDPGAEKKARRARVAEFADKLQLATPDPVLNTAFAFAKIRAGESIFLTKGGLMHSPGGGPYYAAIWANDQAEYANPYFAYFGDAMANEAALNSFRHFARFMNPDYRPIPSAINAEGDGFWHGAKDRGDMAMIAYGAGRFALALGDVNAARELWPLIEWCLEYCHRKLTPEGVVASDSDELENRFPAGDANLCTSSLYYDALNSAGMLGRELGRPATLLADYAAHAKGLRAAIERHFGATVEGFGTYRYYDGNTVLRAWICIPLTVDILERAKGTIDALFSPRLWSADGLLTEAGDKTFWDRSTLYGLRGVLAGGGTERAMEQLSYYSTRRLLGEHVPYPVEAYPEGNQRHLSAESALYCRVFVEGLLGVRPAGLRAFTCRPRLPQGWPGMALRRVHAFGDVFDLVIERQGPGILALKVGRDGKATIVREISEGEAAVFDLA